MNARAAAAAATMYEYYARQSVLPTFANLTSEEEVAAYQAARERVFFERLALPPRTFHGAQVLEFGPDTGENALVFARWGARMTIVEPNERAHAALRRYFAGYAPEGSLEQIATADVLGFADGRRYDAVVAEGFIYTVKPTRAWLEAFARALRPDGLVIVSYYERRGAFFELATRALYEAAKRLGAAPSFEIAERFFATKWAGIPHTRSFASWVMDVLENPFLRLGYALDAENFLREASSAGFDCLSAWPSYRPGFEVAWHKVPRDRAADLERASEHLARCAFGFVTGQSICLTGPRDEVERVGERIDATLATLDALVEGPQGDCERVGAGLEELLGLLRSAPSLGATNAARTSAEEMLTSWRTAFEHLAKGDLAALERLTSSDAAFLTSWGMPAHYAVLRYAGR